jgi:hypothetical protein
MGVALGGAPEGIGVMWVGGLEEWGRGSGARVAWATVTGDR